MGGSVGVDEVRVTNEKTGGQKGQKTQAMSFLPMDVLLDEVAGLYVAGAKKYAKDNWRLGYDWSLSYDALGRHLKQFWYKEHEGDIDPETQCHHLTSVIFHAIALLYFTQAHQELDDRPCLTN